jgi:hypothetical protein
MESRWITGSIILILVLFIVLCIYNSITYGKIANENKTVGDVTPGGARTLQVLNIILTIILFLALFWYFYKFYYNSSEKRAINMEAAKEFAMSKYKQYRNYERQASMSPNPMPQAMMPQSVGAAQAMSPQAMSAASPVRAEGYTANLKTSPIINDVITQAYETVITACSAPGAENNSICAKIL